MVRKSVWWILPAMHIVCACAIHAQSRTYELNFDIQAIHSAGAALRAHNAILTVSEKYNTMAIGSAMHFGYYVMPQLKASISVGQFVMKSRSESHTFRMSSMDIQAQYLISEGTFTPFAQAAVGMGHARIAYKATSDQIFLRPVRKTFDGYVPKVELGTGVRMNLLGDSFCYIGVAYRYIVLTNKTLATGLQSGFQNSTAMQVSDNIGVLIFSGGLIMRW